MQSANMRYERRLEKICNNTVRTECGRQASTTTKQRSLSLESAAAGKRKKAVNRRQWLRRRRCRRRQMQFHYQRSGDQRHTTAERTTSSRDSGRASGRAITSIYRAAVTGGLRCAGVFFLRV